MTIRENLRHISDNCILPLGMYALRIVDDTDDAEDIVEDTFIKAWQTISRVRI